MIAPALIGPALIGPVLLAGCIAAEIGLQLCFKLSAPAAAGHAGNGAWWSAACNAPMWAGIALWAVEMILWIATLQYITLPVAYPVMALTFAGVPLAGRLMLRERLGRAQWLGIALVAAGVACVGASGLAA